MERKKEKCIHAKNIIIPILINSTHFHTNNFLHLNVLFMLTFFVAILFSFFYYSSVSLFASFLSSFGPKTVYYFGAFFSILTIICLPFTNLIKESLRPDFSAVFWIALILVSTYDNFSHFEIFIICALGLNIIPIVLLTTKLVIIIQFYS